MGFAHEFHHEKDGVGLNRGGRFRAVALLLPIMPRARAAKAGVDTEAARKIVAQWIIEACERETPQPRFPDFPAGRLDTFKPFPALHDFLHWRSEPVTSLIAEITARAHPASRVVLIDLAEGWLGGCDLPAVGKVCDGALLCVYALGPEEAAAVIRQGLEALGAEKFLGAGFPAVQRRGRRRRRPDRAGCRLRRSRSQRPQLL